MYNADLKLPIVVVVTVPNSPFYPLCMTMTPMQHSVIGTTLASSLGPSPLLSVGEGLVTFAIKTTVSCCRKSAAPIRLHHLSTWQTVMLASDAPWTELDRAIERTHVVSVARLATSETWERYSLIVDRSAALLKRLSMWKFLTNKSDSLLPAQLAISVCSKHSISSFPAA